MGHPPILVTRLGRAQRDAAVATVVEALSDYPWKRWALAPERFDELHREGSAMSVDLALRHDELWGAGEVDAVACWSPAQSREERLRELPSWFENDDQADFGPPLEDLEELERLTVAALPDARFRYLEVVATRPAAQGLGIGTELLRPALARCEREGIGAAVDTASTRAVPFYERLGFRLRGTVSHGGSPEVHVLYREP